MEWKIGQMFEIDGNIPVTVYESTSSELRVIIAKTPGPIIDGCITFGTETHDNSGVPHTLEHMLFMGSHLYPNKGTLDIIANRCLASGTNAYTDQDNTGYTFSSASSAGFIKVLPVFLSHLLQPNLTEDHYLTEVHHKNGKGRDGGVIYNEMLMVESSMEMMVDRKRKQLFYQVGSGYAAVTAGLVADIKDTSITNVSTIIAICMLLFVGKSTTRIFCLPSKREKNIGYIPQPFTPPFQTLAAPFIRPAPD